MRRKNSGFMLPLLILVLIIVIASVATTVIYLYEEHNRDLQISAFKQFVTDHNYSLNVGTISFTNVAAIITLDRNTFEQKCVMISSEPLFVIIEQHTHTWLVFPQEKFAILDLQNSIAYEWIV